MGARLLHALVSRGINTGAPWRTGEHRCKQRALVAHLATRRRRTSRNCAASWAASGYQRRSTLRPNLASPTTWRVAHRAVMPWRGR